MIITGYIYNGISFPFNFPFFICIMIWKTLYRTEQSQSLNCNTKNSYYFCLQRDGDLTMITLFKLKLYFYVPDEQRAGLDQSVGENPILITHKNGK